MRNPICIRTGAALTIRDNHTHPLLPLCLATLGIIIVSANIGNSGAIVIGAFLLAVALIGCLRSTVVVDRPHGRITVRRGFLGLSTSRRYDLKLVRGVETRWSKFGNVLVLRLVEHRNEWTLRVAGPTRADLGPMVTSIREYLSTRTVAQ